jgi:penicillin-binding protein 2
LAVALFCVIFFRLWTLEIISGSHYLANANNNRVRDITIQAPRGEVFDRNGQVLVDNRTNLAVKLRPDKIPADPGLRDDLYARLGRVLNMKPDDVRRQIADQLAAQPFASPTIKQDVDLPTVSYLLENQDEFPAVTVEHEYVRSYPNKDVGAHLFGTVGEVSKEELDKHVFQDPLVQGDRAGQSGVEYSYDHWLRGVNGATRVQVDASGKPTGELTQRTPIQGNNLKLAIDENVERSAQDAMGGKAGAFVVMDVTNGEVQALGSTPSYDPNIFSKTIKQSDYQRLSAPQNGAPLTNRAIQGLYPTGSTFKLITAIAGLQGGLLTPNTTIDDPGSITISGINFRNAGGEVNGNIALRRAIAVSSDVFFYRLGAQAFSAPGGHLLQDWASKLGIGHKTGIDLPAESRGLVPSPEWRNDLFKRHLTDRPWSVGDDVNLAVGQGDLEVDPLQLSVAYAAVANGGYIVTPHVGLQSFSPAGKPVQTFEPPARQKLDIDPQNRQAILDGMRQAASTPGGTSEPVFAGFPIPVAGKTGTAEVGAGRNDQSWYMALAPYPNPKYVVAVTMEHAGFGAQAAAPAARRILATLFNVQNQANPAAPGASTPG